MSKFKPGDKVVLVMHDDNVFNPAQRGFTRRQGLEIGSVYEVKCFHSGTGWLEVWLGGYKGFNAYNVDCFSHIEEPTEEAKIVDSFNLFEILET